MNPCLAQGCPRQARNKKKPGYCATCRTRRYTGASPKFPAQPLLDFMDARGRGFPENQERPKPGSKISLERLDAICIDLLGVHPYQVYGDLYFQECVA